MFMKTEGISELLKMGDDFTIDVDNEDVIELELSENDDYMSLIYNKTNKEYSLEYMDLVELEEYVIPIDENNFDGFEINNVKITKEIFDKFKSLVEQI